MVLLEQFQFILLLPRSARAKRLHSLRWSPCLEVDQRVAQLVQVEVVVGDVHRLFLVHIAGSAAGYHRQVMLRGEYFVSTRMHAVSITLLHPLTFKRVACLPRKSEWVILTIFAGWRHEVLHSVVFITEGSSLKQFIKL